MWARKRIDIGLGELFAALAVCLFGKKNAAADSIARIADCFLGLDKPLVCLSVRSGFDLFLQTAIKQFGWEADSEIIFSGLTIPDMPKIARRNGLKVLGCNVDWKTLEPCLADIESKIGRKTKAIVVAHLMGSKIDLGPIAELAERNNLVLIEDCAQSFTGKDDFSEHADVSMLSFGSIKTCTALGGAVFRVRDPELRVKMAQAHLDWPIQSTWQYMKKLGKYCMVRLISTWPIAALIRMTFKAVGSNHDKMAAGMARGFAGPNFFDRIRHRPSASLTSVLARRLERFDTSTISERKKRGQLLFVTIGALNDELMPLGIHTRLPTHWVFAILVANRDELVQLLWDQGFDATTHSSLIPVGESDNDAFAFMKHVVFLPVDLPMPERELIRMGKLVAENAESYLELEKTTPKYVRV